jgi:hypothetical protein
MELEMRKQLLAGAAVLALMTGAAVAQTTTETTTSRTTVTPLSPPIAAPADAYTATRTERSMFGGATVETQKSYRNGPDGSSATTQQKVVRPDGSSETTSRTDWSTAGAVPNPVPPSSTSITTTTTR